MLNEEILKYLEDILEQNSVAPTAMRLLVLDFMLKHNDVAVSLSDIEDNFYKADRTTIFRTIKKFAQSKIVHRIDDGSGITKYAICKPGCHCEMETDLHLHFHCTSCGETVCFPNSHIPKFELEEGYVEEQINFVVTGKCKKCNTAL